MAMGVGRFAYTALLPSLRVGLGFDAAAGGTIASANLLGYLIGALWARHTPPGGPRRWLVRTGLALSVITTGAVVACTSLETWSAIRFLGGVASGLVFVLVSASVLETLPLGAEAHAGILYSGVGAGIALSGTVAALWPATTWKTPWLLLACVSAVLAAPTWLQRPRPPISRRPVTVAAGPASRAPTFRLLTTAYFLEGLGYIVSGTFAVTAVQHTPRLSGWAPWVWVAAGVAAAPSAVIWSRVAGRVGAQRALVSAYAAQAVGMALPALSGSAAAALVGALLFGGTFMGIVTVLLDLARRIEPSSASRTIGTLTVVYGVGQTLGPILAGWLTRAAGDPAPAALAAATAVALGAVLLAASGPGARSADDRERQRVVRPPK